MSKARKKSSGQGKYLPESTKGKIQQILENPDIESRRRIAHEHSMRGNLNGFKKGKYVTGNTFTTCNHCYVSDKCPVYQAPTPDNPSPLCAFSDMFNGIFKIENFDVRNFYSVIESYNCVVTSLLQRLARASFFEELDGGMLDKSLVPLYKSLSDFLKVRRKDLASLPREYMQTNSQIFAEEVKKLSPEQQKIITDALSKALEIGGGEYQYPVCSP